MQYLLYSYKSYIAHVHHGMLYILRVFIARIMLYSNRVYHSLISQFKIFSF